MPFTKGHKINVGRKMSDNQKKKLSKNHAGKSNPMYGKPAWNKGRICPQLSGINNGFYNKHHDKKTRTRMSIAKSGTISNH